ncbi:MAG TPA: VOC family protein [Longimicrobiales bacterium]|nr:VOC family protein [Longimicrobiales bacterium]
MRLIPYLNFDGTCAEAFRFYERVLGGQAQIMRMGDTPMAPDLPPEVHDRIMHAYLEAGGAVLMGSDTPLGQSVKPEGLAVALTTEDPAEAERIFNELADGGTITMPIQQTFWAQRFGMLVDRYGIPWLINGGTPEEG